MNMPCTYLFQDEATTVCPSKHVSIYRDFFRIAWFLLLNPSPIVHCCMAVYLVFYLKNSEILYRKFPYANHHPHPSMHASKCTFAVFPCAMPWSWCWANSNWDGKVTLLPLWQWFQFLLLMLNPFFQDLDLIDISPLLLHIFYVVVYLCSAHNTPSYKDRQQERKRDEKSPCCLQCTPKKADLTDSSQHQCAVFQVPPTFIRMHTLTCMQDQLKMWCDVWKREGHGQK